MYCRIFVLVSVLATFISADFPPKNSFLEKCISHDSINEIANCTTLKVFQYIQRADKIKTLEVFPGITLRRNESAQQFFPKHPKNASQAIDLIYDATSNFMSNRVLNIKLPLSQSENIGRALEEGRGKMKKMMGSLLLGFGTKMMTMVPMMFGVVLLLTTKALIVGKLAFVLSVVLFINMFFGTRPYIPFGGGGSFGIPPTYGVPTTYGTNNIGGWNQAQYPYARSLDENETN